MIMEANAARKWELSLSMHDFFAYRDAQRSFDTFGAWSQPRSRRRRRATERVDAARDARRVERDALRPLLGQFRAEDEAPGAGWSSYSRTRPARSVQAIRA